MTTEQIFIEYLFYSNKYTGGKQVGKKYQRMIQNRKLLQKYYSWLHNLCFTDGKILQSISIIFTTQIRIFGWLKIIFVWKDLINELNYGLKINLIFIRSLVNILRTHLSNFCIIMEILVFVFSRFPR